MGKIHSKPKKEDQSKRKKGRKEGEARGASEGEQPMSPPKPLHKTDTTQTQSSQASTTSNIPLRPQQTEGSAIITKDFQPEQPPKSSKSKGKEPEETIKLYFNFDRYREIFEKDQIYIQLLIAANNYRGLSWTELKTNQHFRHEVAFGEEDWEKLCDGLDKRDMKAMEQRKADYYHYFAQTAVLEGLLKSSALQYELFGNLYHDCLEVPYLFDTLKHEKNETDKQYKARVERFLKKRMQNFFKERSMSGDS